MIFNYICKKYYYTDNTEILHSIKFEYYIWLYPYTGMNNSCINKKYLRISTVSN